MADKHDLGLSRPKDDQVAESQAQLWGLSTDETT